MYVDHPEGVLFSATKVKLHFEETKHVYAVFIFCPCVHIRINSKQFGKEQTHVDHKFSDTFGNLQTGLLFTYFYSYFLFRLKQF